MLKKILYLIEAFLLVVHVISSGVGIWLIANIVVAYVWGTEYLRIPAEMVFLIGGILLAIGLVKLLEIVQYQLLHIQAVEIEEEYRLNAEPEAMKLFEHLRVK